MTKKKNPINLLLKKKIQNVKCESNEFDKKVNVLSLMCVISNIWKYFSYSVGFSFIKTIHFLIASPNQKSTNKKGYKAL
jgi:hypothetical protein